MGAIELRHCATVGYNSVGSSAWSITGTHGTPCVPVMDHGSYTHGTPCVYTVYLVKTIYRIFQIIGGEKCFADQSVTVKLLQWNNLHLYKTTVQPQMLSSKLKFSFATVKLSTSNDLQYTATHVWRHHPIHVCKG